MTERDATDAIDANKPQSPIRNPAAPKKEGDRDVADPHKGTIPGRGPGGQQEAEPLPRF